MLHVWGVVKTPSSVSEMRTVDHYMTYCQHLIWIVTEMAIRRYLDRPALLHEVSMRKPSVTNTNAMNNSFFFASKTGDIELSYLRLNRIKLVWSLKMT